MVRLQALEATARLGSLKQAAEELGVTPSAISHRLKDLEHDLGLTLFVRQYRKIALTEEGEALAKTLTTAFASIQKQLAALSGPSAAQILTISCAPTFANRFILPHLPEFHEKHPSIALSVIGTNEQAELDSGLIDAGIRFAHTTDSELNSRVLAPIRGLIVGSPAIIDVCKRSKAVKVPRLSITHLPDLWREHIANSAFEFPDTVDTISFESLEAALEATLAGIGLSMIPSIYIESELNENRLAILEEVRVEPVYSYFLVTAKEPIKRKQIATFARWISGKLQQHLPRAD